MSVSTSIAIIASTNASIAAANAARAEREAHEAKCRVIIGQFDSKSAGVSEAQQYASCVQYVYPVKSDEPPSLLLKACVFGLIVSIIIGMVVAVFRIANGRDSSLGDYIAFGALGAMVGAFIFGAILGLCAGISFLIS